MVSTSPSGQIINYSDRFTLVGMTGAFPASISAALSSMSPTDLSGPLGTNDDAPGTSSSTSTYIASYDIPYNLQDGQTRYAPMQPIPGTRITARSASMQWPTSFAVIAKTWLPAASVVTTLTQVQTASRSSRENTVSAVTCSSSQGTESEGLPGFCAYGRHGEISRSLARVGFRDADGQYCQRSVYQHRARMA
ncbi:hypothetical protein MRB53_039442 [Persea americana]|nr:hypothetical protein MRB53_039442 [Persea americana]